MGVRRVAGKSLKVTILWLVGLYAAIWCLVGLLLGGGWGAGVLVGFIAVGAGTCLSWRYPAPGGLLIVLGAILGGVSFGVSGYACVGGCPTYGTADEIAVSVAVGIVPSIVGLWFLALGLWQRRHRPQA